MVRGSFGWVAVRAGGDAAAPAQTGAPRAHPALPLVLPLLLPLVPALLMWSWLWPLALVSAPVTARLRQAMPAKSKAPDGRWAARHQRRTRWTWR